MNEFEFIRRKLSPLSPVNALDNDAFVYDKNTVITKDIIIEGVHFLPKTEPCYIAKKALRVNLSDIASMGAKPYGYFLGLAINNTAEDWLEGFVSGLAEDNKEFSIKLLGGDTTVHAGDNVISVTMLGRLYNKQCLARCSAKVGDAVYVTGNIGEAAIGLLTYSEDQLSPLRSLQELYKLPKPQVAIGLEISGVASSCIDISDGLLQDAEQICLASNVGMEIDINKIPFSTEVKKAISIDGKYLEKAITGGDDYQLLFTAQSLMNDLNVTEIGKVVSGSSVRLINQGVRQFVRSGYSHF